MHVYASTVLTFGSKNVVQIHVQTTSCRVPLKALLQDTAAAPALRARLSGVSPLLLSSKGYKPLNRFVRRPMDCFFLWKYEYSHSSRLCTFEPAMLLNFLFGITILIPSVQRCPCQIETRCNSSFFRWLNMILLPMPKIEGTANFEISLSTYHTFVFSWYVPGTSTCAARYVLRARGRVFFSPAPPRNVQTSTCVLLLITHYVVHAPLIISSVLAIVISFFPCTTAKYRRYPHVVSCLWHTWYLLHTRLITS